MKKSTHSHNSRRIRMGIRMGVATVVLFTLFLPQMANANILSDALESIGKDILITLILAVHKVLNWCLIAASSVFEGVLDVGFKGAIVRVAKIGWGVARDFSNMFFILFLVIIAFATILRIERYGLKQLLPKVIIIALLINFSFVITAVIIDFSNITADFFIRDIKSKISGKDKSIITATFADSLSMSEVMISYTDCGDFRNKKTTECMTQIKWYQIFAVPGSAPMFQNACLQRVEALYRKCVDQGSITVTEDFKGDANFFSLVLSLTVGSIVLLIAAFTFLAGAFLLLIRIIALWLLIVVVPLVFICYIMPGLEMIWRKWWSAFLSWCFFAPAYAFFIWMAIQIAVTGANRAIGNITESTPAGEFSATTNPFVADPGAQLIGYGIMIAFLLGGLIMAKQIGIYGASAAIKVGQRMAGAERVKRYLAARKAVREEEKKEAVKRKLRLREVGGLRQAIKERVPGEIGRRARARKMDVITTEANRMAKHYGLRDIRRVMGYRGFTGFRRTSRLAAAKASAAPKFSAAKATLSPSQITQLNQWLAKLNNILSRYQKP